MAPRVAINFSSSGVVQHLHGCLVAARLSGRLSAAVAAVVWGCKLVGAHTRVTSSRGDVKAAPELVGTSASAVGCDSSGGSVTELTRGE